MEQVFNINDELSGKIALLKGGGKWAVNAIVERSDFVKI